MFRISLRATLGLVAVVAAVCGTLVSPTVPLAFLVLLSTIGAIAIALLLAHRIPASRRKCLFAAGVAFIYLAIADGWVVSDSERVLPTEWLLERCTTEHTYLGNGIKRPYCQSLAGWLANECHRTNLLPSRPLTENLIQLQGSSIEATPLPVATSTITLPRFTFVTATTTILVSRRDDPENKPTFIIAHCWVALFAILATLTRTLPNSNCGN